MFDDELDEQKGSNGNSGRTTTYIMDVSVLEQPKLAGTHVSPVTSIDHNLYILGNYAYMANYCSGLRIVDISGISTNSTTEWGYFDVRPEDDKVQFKGSWSSYIYFPSGNVVVNSIERGLFVVKPKFQS
jgi:choice-of-anchor B domain-containing protein